MHSSWSKRGFDLAAGSVLCFLATPLLVVLALGVAISLRAWPLFSHDRVGRGGATIRVRKLRTLPPTTPRYANKFNLDIEHMPLPWLCRVLRRTHLDELPQLLLVVRGHMSLVGPRPVQPPDIEPIDAAYALQRSRVLPGCTGLWQISTASSGTATSAPEFDLFYIANASLRLDLWILARTVRWMLKLAKPISLHDIPRYLLIKDATTDAVPAARSAESHPVRFVSQIVRQAPYADDSASARAVAD